MRGGTGVYGDVGDGGGGWRWVMAKYFTCVSRADAHYFKDKL